MKLVVLGANGRTGGHVLKTALSRGMTVTAVVRSEQKRPRLSHERLTVVFGDPTDADFLAEVLQGQDAVVSTLGGHSPTKAGMAIYARAADAIIAAAKHTGLQRVIVTSTALLFPEQTLLGKILRFVVPNTVNSAAGMERRLRASGLNWTSARPGFLNDADTALYRSEANALPRNGTAVARRALAQFLIDALDDPQTHRCAYGVSAAAA